MIENTVNNGDIPTARDSETRESPFDYVEIPSNRGMYLYVFQSKWENSIFSMVTVENNHRQMILLPKILPFPIEFLMSLFIEHEAYWLLYICLEPVFYDREDTRWSKKFLG